MNASLEDPGVRARMVENGVEIETSPTPEDFAKFLVTERERWGVVVRRANLRAE
jgi:tripartite-type tricarboxylate transporter receptor subunit TctC